MQITVTCQRCAEPFGYDWIKPARGGQKRRYCDACREAVYDEAIAGRRSRYVPVPRPQAFCRDCGVALEADAIRRQGGGRTTIRCGGCHLTKQRRKWRTAQMRKHGLTVAQYDALLAGQGGSCAVAGCGRSDDGRGRSLHIDHDHACCPGAHSCGQCVRGLLCATHNIGVGYFANDPAMLRAAAAYLEATARARLHAV